MRKRLPFNGLPPLRAYRAVLLLLALSVSAPAAAQWHVGVTAGYSCNKLCMDTGYAYDMRYEERGGFTVGIPVQYDFFDWLGVRAEVSFVQKGHKMHRTDVWNKLHTDTRNNYLRLIQETPEIKGVILDVRGNGGGYLADMQYTIAPLIDEELLIGYTRVKEGLGRLDYAPWIPSTLTPAARHRKVEAPVVALTDILSYSMAEMTAMAVSELPGGCVIGERTLGATGPLTDNYAFSYSGQVNNPYMMIYTSTAMIKDAKGVNHEGVGVTPDIEVFYDEAAMESGTDVQLDRAIEYIHTGR